MKLEKTTWSLLITAAFLCMGVYFYEIQFKPETEEIQSQNQKIFDFPEKNIKSLTIETPQETFKFERTEDEQKSWKMNQPQEKIASDAAVAFLTNLLVTGESDRSFRIPVNQKKDYGLIKPLATIKITLDDNMNHQLILGESDFKDEFLYAQVDPNNEDKTETTISLVPKDFQYIVERQIEDWLDIEEKSKPPENPEDNQLEPKED